MRLSSTSVSFLYVSSLFATRTDMPPPAFGSQNMNRFRVPFRLYSSHTLDSGLAPMDGLLSATNCLDVSSKQTTGWSRSLHGTGPARPPLLPAHLRDGLRPRLEFVFLSVWRIGSRSPCRQGAASSACVLRAHQLQARLGALPAYRPTCASVPVAGAHCRVLPVHTACAHVPPWRRLSIVRWRCPRSIRPSSALRAIA